MCRVSCACVKVLSRQDTLTLALLSWLVMHLSYLCGHDGPDVFDVRINPDGFRVTVLRDDDGPCGVGVLPAWFHRPLSSVRQCPGR